MKRFFFALLLTGLVPQLGWSSELLRFSTMYPLDSTLVHNPIRGVSGDFFPWVIRSAYGYLSSSGELEVHVRGLVPANTPDVPPDARGFNDYPTYYAMVSCMSTESGTVKATNVGTKAFKATSTGNSDIETKVNLPAGGCIAPIVFILCDQDKWVAITGGGAPGGKW